MKAIFNVLTPFFGNNGMPLAGGRVLLCALGSDSERIEVFDHDGTPLQNPIPLNDMGRFEDGKQPFVPDDVSFTAYVQERTGEASHTFDGYDDTDAWATIYYFDVFGETQGTMATPTAVLPVPNIDTLRNTDPQNADFVLLLGYFEAGDAPARLYTWKNGGTPKDNGGSCITSRSSSGFWEMVPGPTDVRNWGVIPGADECTIELRKCFESITPEYAPLYFPGGVFRISFSLSLPSKAVFAISTKFQNVSSSGNVSLYLKEFEADEDGVYFIPNNDADKPYFVLPCIGCGTFFSKWFGGEKSLIWNTAQPLLHVERLVYGEDLESYVFDPQKAFVKKAFERGPNLKRIEWPNIEDGRITSWNVNYNTDVSFFKPATFMDDVNLMYKTKAFDNIEIDASASLIAKGDVSVGGSLNVNGEASFESKVTAQDINAPSANINKIVANRISSGEFEGGDIDADTIEGYCFRIGNNGQAMDPSDPYGGDRSSWIRLKKIAATVAENVYHLDNVNVNDYSVGCVVIFTNASDLFMTLKYYKCKLNDYGQWSTAFDNEADKALGPCESAMFIYLGSHKKENDDYVRCWSLIT